MPKLNDSYFIEITYQLLSLALSHSSNLSWYLFWCFLKYSLLWDLKSYTKQWNCFGRSFERCFIFWWFIKQRFWVVWTHNSCIATILAVRMCFLFLWIAKLLLWLVLNSYSSHLIHSCSSIGVCFLILCDFKNVFRLVL